MIEGKWHIGNIQLKNDGFIDLDLCLVGKGDIVDGCNDTPDTNKHEPAFWGHMAGISLIKGGITKQENDPILPLLWNVGKVHINVTDALQIKKIKLANGTFTNKIIINKNNLIDGIHGSIQLDPYPECDAFYHEKYGDSQPTPFGCDQTAGPTIYPVVIDRTALAGESAWYDLSNEGKNPWLLIILRKELIATFKNMVSCLVKEQVNPMINPDAFPYQPWMIEDDKLDLNIAVQKDDDGEGVVIKQLKDATNPILTVSPNIKDADVITSDSGVVVKLPFTLAANNVKSSVSSNDKIWGHMYREPSASLDANYPLSEVEDKPYLGISIGIEELLHSATSVIFKKGIQPLLDLLDVTDFKYPKNHPQPDDWTIGLDSVILGNLEICNDLADKLLKTSLPASMTFSNYESLFTNDSAHWDITLDPNSPPTLNMIDIPVVETEDSETSTAKPVTEKPTSSARLELGLTNVVISVFDFIKTAEDKELYKIADSAIFKIRLDALIKLNLDYFKDQRKLVIKIDSFNNIPAYVTVIDKGIAYDDSKVLVDLKDLLLKKAFNSLADGTMEVTFPANLSGFNTIGFGREGTKKVEDAQKAGGVVILDKTKLGENGSCDKITTPEYDESSSNRFTFNHDILKPYNQKPIALKDLKDLLIPKNILSDMPRSLLQNNSNKSSTTNTDADFDPENPCDFLDDAKLYIGDNDIKDSLCDAGIKEISMGEGDPNIILDTENGYIHLSTKIMIEVYDWLSKQNNGEPIDNDTAN
ncbi:MAG: hypothetical protein ACD_73C00011G0001 [uncultured bacterium]|nr:MAG: hypothetical protein ACD_73C00011G0001 [uncultured bacterium]